MRLALPLATLLLAGPALAQPAPSGQGLPPALRALFERELKKLAVRPVDLGQGVTGRVEAAAAPPAPAEGAPVSISLGTASPVICEVHVERIDAASSTWRVVEAVKKGLSVLLAKPAAVASVAGSPILFSEVVYKQDSPQGAKVGLLKVAVFVHDAHSLLCQHDEPGYSATFQRVVKGLAASLRGGGEDERAGARWADLSVLRIAGMEVGYAERVVWDRQGGGRVLTVTTSMLMPRSPTDQVALEIFSEEGIAEDGLIEVGTYVHATNGELDQRMKVERQDGGDAYAYEGEKSGKRLSGTLTAAGGLASDLWFARRLRKGVAVPEGGVRHLTYAFESSPTAPIEQVIKPDPAKARRVDVTAGPVTLGGTLDDHGLLGDFSVPLGQASMEAARLWTRGAP